jgi:hypothetical protein
MRDADSNAVQKPRNGPNENANSSRSAGLTPTTSNIVRHEPSMRSQLSGVSSQRKGAPFVPDVWCKREYRSSG